VQVKAPFLNNFWAGESPPSGDDKGRFSDFNNLDSEPSANLCEATDWPAGDSFGEIGEDWSTCFSIATGR
jgi:hypothetical protein